MRLILSVIFSLIIGICCTQITTFPHSSSFASGFGDWNQSTTDDFDWTQKTSGTTSSGTGPQSSPYGANGTTGYVYTETSSPITNNQTARIYCTYDLSDATTASVTFYYHIYASSGYGPGTLRLKIYKGNSSSGGTVNYPWIVTNSYNGWQQATISLNDYIGYSYVQLSFESITPSSGTVWQCDNAIDEVVVSRTTDNSGNGGSGSTIEVGDPNSNLQNGRVPAYGYYDYSWSAAIYTAAELGGTAQTIEKISWNVANGNSMTLNNQEIWIAHTPEEVFPDETMPDVGNGPWNGFVRVFNGSLPFSPGWNEVALSSTFDFNGVENLLVKVVNNHGAYAFSYPEFQYTSKTNSVVYNYKDGSFPSTTGTLNAFRPNTRFAMGGDALPIDLVSFDGEVLLEMNPVVLLEWTVASQVNNEYFKIERSENLDSWNLIDSIRGNGTTNMELRYSLIDDNPLNGVNYYRLSQTDHNGATKIFNPIAITLNNEEKVISKIINIAGQEVSKDYNGIIIEIYTDGTSRKLYKEH